MPPTAPRAPSAARRWLWLLAGAGIGLLVASALLLLPAVQGWLIRSLVATQAGWRLEAEHIGINPLGLDARGVDFRMPGLRATMAPVRVRISPSRFFRRELYIDQADVSQLRLEITPADLESSDEPFLGLLGELAAAVPIRWSLAQASLQGHIAIHDAGETLVAGDLTVSGGGSGSALASDFTYELAAASFLLPPGEANRIHSTGTVHVRQDGAGSVDRIEFDGDLRLPRYGSVQLPNGRFNLVVEVAPAGESYAFTVSLPSATTFTFNGAFNRLNHGLRGTFAARTDDTLLADLLAPDRAPPQLSARLTGAVDLDVDRGNGALDFAADLNASEWHRLLPQLHDLPQLLGTLAGRVVLPASGDPELSHLEARLHTADDSTAIALKSTRPLALTSAAPPATESVATLELHGIPVAWANPFLAPDIAVDSGQLNARWSVSREPSGQLALTPETPLSLAGLHLVLPDRALPVVNLAADVHMRADPAAHTAASHGEVRVQVPELWPYDARLQWAADHTLETTRIESFHVDLRSPGADLPALALTSLQALEAQHETGALTSDPGDLATFKVHDLSLDWLAPWLPDGVALGGIWRTAESIIRAAPDHQGGSLSTPVAWQFTQLRVKAGGVERTLNARLVPTATTSLTGYAAGLRIDSLETDSGEALTGEISGAWNPDDRTYQARVVLDARAPAPADLPIAGQPLDVHLEFTAAPIVDNVHGVEQLGLTVRAPDQELVRIESPDTVMAVRKPDGEIVLATNSALTVTLPDLPLTWIKSWLPPETLLEGNLSAGRYLLFLEPQRVTLRAIAPTKVTGLRWTGPGLPTVADVEAEVYMSVDASVLHRVAPDFYFAIEGTLHANSGVLRRDGQVVGEFDMGLGFLGDPRTVLPRGIAGQGYLDFAQLHDLGLPASGTLSYRLSGDVLGETPLDIWLRVDDLPDNTPALELAAHSRIEGKNALVQSDFSIRVFGDRTSDLAFAAELQMDEGLLHVDSALRSAYLNLDDLLKVASLNRRSVPEPAPPLDPTNSNETIEPVGDEATPAPTEPFWSLLRGKFDLDLAEVDFAPYAVRGLGGLMEVTAQSVTLSELTGSMFSGEWGGELALDFDAVRGADPYDASGGFRIHQFETARAVQTVFPNEFGSFDARIDLQADVHSRAADLFSLIRNAEASFTVEGRNGMLHLTHPDARTASTLLVLGGTLSFSPELRALGRLLRKFSEMPVDQLRIGGTRTPDGRLALTALEIDSPQLRLRGAGFVPADDDVPLMGRSLDVALELEAREEMAVILGRMKLLEKSRSEDGYQRMTSPLKLGGEVGKPDPSPLYDLFARAVSGSRGTWGLIMRQVEKKLEKEAAKTSAPPSR